MLRALEHGIGIEEFWNLTEGDFRILVRAHQNLVDAARFAALRSFWHLANWTRNGVPDWDALQSALRGETAKAKTPEELLRKVIPFVFQLGGKDKRKKAAPSNG